MGIQLATNSRMAATDADWTLFFSPWEFALMLVFIVKSDDMIQ